MTSKRNTIVMEKQIERLISFVEEHDPTKELNTLSKYDKKLKETWK